MGTNKDIKVFSKKLELMPEKVVYTDHLTIEIMPLEVRFHVRIDGSGNTFMIRKEALIESLRGW